MKHLCILTSLFVVTSAFAGWDYSSDKEPMTGKETKYAITTSPTQAKLGFPYQGANLVTLMTRKSPKYGLDVIVQVEKGQLTCDYDLCQVLVRFDDEPAKKWTVNKPADHSSNVYFIANDNAFLVKLKKAKKVLVELQFYQNGNQVFDFQTSGLNF